MGEVCNVEINGENFHLGSLNSMMMNLDELNKLDNQCEVLIRKIEKVYTEHSTEAPLNNRKIDTKNLGNVKIKDYLQNFEWDDLKFPRSGNIIQPIKDKLISLDNEMKSKIDDLNNAKTTFNSYGDDNPETASLYNINLNDLISQMEKKENKKFESVFDFESMIGEKSKYLKNVLVFIPNKEYEKFREEYTELDDQIVAGSLVTLGNVKNFMVARVIYFKEFSGNFTQLVKEKYKGVSRNFNYDASLARERKEGRDKSNFFII